MVRLTVNDALRQKLLALLDTSSGLGNQVPLEVSELVQDYADRDAQWIVHTTLVKVSKWNRGRDTHDPAYTLRNLVKGSEVYIDPPVVKERSAKLEAILAPIRLAQEQASYADMMSPSAQPVPRNLDLHDTSSHWDFNTASHPRLTVRQEWEAARKELSAVFNVLASMAAVGTAVWWISGGYLLAQRVLMSLFGAIGIGAVEGLLYVLLSRSRSSKPPKAFTVDRTAPTKRVSHSLTPARIKSSARDAT